MYIYIYICSYFFTKILRVFPIKISPGRCLDPPEAIQCPPAPVLEHFTRVMEAIGSAVAGPGHRGIGGDFAARNGAFLDDNHRKTIGKW